jgi:hypothetical protein
MEDRLSREDRAVFLQASGLGEWVDLQRGLSEGRLKERLQEDRITAAQRELGFQECLDQVAVWIMEFRKEGQNARP